jgi:hypothetical protein
MRLVPPWESPQPYQRLEVVSLLIHTAKTAWHWPLEFTAEGYQETLPFRLLQVLELAQVVQLH